jgi:hypothetical protein
VKAKLFGAKFKQPGWGWEWFIEYRGAIYSTGIGYSVRGLRMPYVYFLALAVHQTDGHGACQVWTEDEIARRAA